MDNTIITKEGYVLETEDDSEVTYQEEQENTTEYIMATNDDSTKKNEAV